MVDVTAVRLGLLRKGEWGRRMGLLGERLTKEIAKERKDIVQMERREGLRRDSKVR